MIRSRDALILAAAAFLLSGGARAAPDDIKVCEVIPAGDVESTLGFKAAQVKPGYRECQWNAATPGVFGKVTALKRYEHKVSGTEYAELMKKMGGTATITDDTPELWCARITMPANNVPLVECRALTKGHYFEVKAVGAGMTREKAKALVGKLSARLP